MSKQFSELNNNENEFCNNSNQYSDFQPPEFETSNNNNNVIEQSIIV